MRTPTYAVSLVATALLLWTPLARAELPSPSDALTVETDDGRFSLEPIMQLQAFGFVGQDLGPGGASRGGFLIRRARLGLGGHLFTRDLRFEVEGNWDSGQPALQDAFVTYELAPALVVQGGLFKRPFSRNFIVSSKRSTTFERAFTHDSFFIGRDVGVMLHNDYSTSPSGLEYAVALVNGTGEAVRLNRDALPLFNVSHAPAMLHPALVGRLAINVGGIDGYVEGDLERGPLRFSVGSSVLYDAPSLDNDGLASAEVDFALKAHGFFATGALFLESGPLDGDASQGELGAFLRSTYTLGDNLLPTLAWGMVSPIMGESARHEVVAGAAVLLFGWNARLMTDASVVAEQRLGTLTATDVAVRFGFEVNL